MLQIKKAIQQNLTAASTSVVQYGILQPADCDTIKQLYDSYKSEIGTPDSVFQTEFLYIPSENEIIDTLSGNKACYIGAWNNARLVAVMKLQELPITPTNKATPFFVPPQAERNTSGRFFGISGMLTSKACRGKGVVLPMITQILNALKANKATGVYADCDYRNISSFNALSGFLNFIGFTDGRNGLPGEQTIYMTFYNSFNTTRPTVNKSLAVSDASPADAFQTLRNFMSSMGQNAYTASKIPLGNGRFNRVYVLTEDKKIKLQKITDSAKERWNPGQCVVKKEDRKISLSIPDKGREYEK